VPQGFLPKDCVMPHYSAKELCGNERAPWQKWWLRVCSTRKAPLLGGLQGGIVLRLVSSLRYLGNTRRRYHLWVFTVALLEFLL
jgi:hypothetical protein